MRDSPRKHDPRRAATRRAMLDAFFVAALSMPYEQISVEALARAAGVSRSTFYANFAGKNALLAVSLHGVFEPLADVVLDGNGTHKLTAVLEHFWQNRARARSLFTPGMRGPIVEVLARLVEKRLARGVALLLPRRLAALQIAESVLSPVIAWLLGEEYFPVPRLALALRESGRGLVLALRKPANGPRR